MTSFAEKERLGTCVALGNFDGIHLGHQKIIEACVEEGKKDGLISLVWSFRRHPEHIMKGNFSSGNIISNKDKERILKKMGVSHLILEDFERVRDFSPQVFCEEILLRKLSAKKVFCGFNFRFGKGGEGDAAYLKEYLEPRGVQVFTEDPVCYGGQPISSTKIRGFLNEGKVEEAGSFLGRPYSICFPVLQGKRLGRRIGFPTLNQAFPEEYVTPKKGVYAVRVIFDEKEYFGVCNVGSRPTVDQDDRIIAETHLFDFSGELYGKEVRVEFYKFLRPETRFSSLEELKTQIGKDREEARLFWEEKK
ncbi:MAG: bifunctional riboflavin kinase/FAD synthetase [Clostridia bacterium]|nr:bifunctional riboflavin kinase/FAD synthetase [Clostridia bacterium]